MEDLKHIVSLGFSGGDILRALLITFAIAILIRKKRSAWFLGAIALIIDRLIWPIAGMGVAGAEMQSIYASIGALAKTFVDDLGLYVVRYVGLTIMIAMFIALRGNLHAKLAPPKQKPAHA